jgi:hypothetical protein
MHTTDVLQSYWTSDGLPLYCSQPTGEKTHTNPVVIAAAIPDVMLLPTDECFAQEV